MPCQNPITSMSTMKAHMATCSRSRRSLRCMTQRVKRMNTKSRNHVESVMCQRFQKSMMSTAANGARKFRGQRMPRQ